MKNYHNGNALFLILIAVALFAALSYAVTNSGRGGGGIDKEAQALAISQLLQYEASFHTAFNRMNIINGCKENQYTFEDHRDTISAINGTPYDFTNINAPGDGSCGFFHQNGGGIIPQDIPSEIAISPESVSSTAFSHPQATLLQSVEILGNGTDGGAAANAELVLRMGRLTREACIEINNIIGIANPSGEPPLDRGDSALFTGNYNPATYVIGDQADTLEGETLFCSENNDSTGGGQSYHLFSVLMAR